MKVCGTEKRTDGCRLTGLTSSEGRIGSGRSRRRSTRRSTRRRCLCPIHFTIHAFPSTASFDQNENNFKNDTLKCRVNRPLVPANVSAASCSPCRADQVTIRHALRIGLPDRAVEEVRNTSSSSALIDCSLIFWFSFLYRKRENEIYKKAIFHQCNIQFCLTVRYCNFAFLISIHEH